MSERSSYEPGEFCWVDVSVPSTEAGAEFYNELIGWEWQASEDPNAGGYGLFSNGGKVVAGMGPLQNEQQPPAWASYISVADADETAAKIKQAGGTVMMDTFDVLEAGRMAVCQDPQGAVFCIWQAGVMKGAELVNEVGAWTWNHLTTHDLEGAEKFYGEVFGWSLQAAGQEAAPDSPFMMWQVAGQKFEEGLGGANEIGPDDPAGMPSNWTAYLSVESAEKAVATTSGGGGQVLVPVTEIPVGKLAVLTDPQGAVFGIIEPDYPEPR